MTKYGWDRENRERLWSPNMRRWAGDVEKHGRPTHWYEGGGVAQSIGNFLLAEDLTPLLTEDGNNLLWM